MFKLLLLPLPILLSATTVYAQNPREIADKVLEYAVGGDLECAPFVASGACTSFERCNGIMQHIRNAATAALHPENFDEFYRQVDRMYTRSVSSSMNIKCFKAITGIAPRPIIRDNVICPLRRIAGDSTKGCP